MTDRPTWTYGELVVLSWLIGRRIGKWIGRRRPRSVQGPPLPCFCVGTMGCSEELAEFVAGQNRVCQRRLEKEAEEQVTGPVYVRVRSAPSP